MNRRSVLANAALLAGASAGCVAGVAPPTAESETPPIPDHRDLPELPIEDDVYWAHEAHEREISLDEISDPVTLPDEIVVVLRNESNKRLEGNPYSWRLYKLHEDEWVDIAPRAVPLPLMTAPPGRSIGHMHVLRHERTEVDTQEFASEEPDDVDEYDPEDHPVHVGSTVGLGGGRYALTLGFAAENGVTHAVTFGVEAPAVELTPDEAISIDIEDGTAIVEYEGGSRRWGHTEERPDPERVDRTLVPESLSSRTYSPLRTGIALLRQHEAVTEVYVGYEIGALEFGIEDRVWILQLGDDRYARQEVDGPP